MPVTTEEGRNSGFGERAPLEEGGVETLGSLGHFEYLYNSGGEGRGDLFFWEGRFG